MTYDPKKRRARYLQHRDRELDRAAAYYQEHRGQVREIQRARYAADPQAAVRASLAWRKEHPEEYRTYMREYMRQRRQVCKSVTLDSSL